MANVRKRIESLEKSLGPELSSNPHGDMMRLAVQSLPTDDLMLLIAVTESGQMESEWTEGESAAVQALAGAFLQEVLRAGYRSIAEFERHTFEQPNGSKPQLNVGRYAKSQKTFGAS
jgi:hypothetical protein